MNVCLVEYLVSLFRIKVRMIMNKYLLNKMNDFRGSNWDNKMSTSALVGVD